MASSTSPKNAQVDLFKEDEISANKKFKVVPLPSTKNAKSKQINFDEQPGRASLQNKPN